MLKDLKQLKSYDAFCAYFTQIGPYIPAVNLLNEQYTKLTEDRKAFFIFQFRIVEAGKEYHFQRFYGSPSEWACVVVEQGREVGFERDVPCEINTYLTWLFSESGVDYMDCFSDVEKLGDNGETE